MHELSLMAQILEIADETAAREGSSAIRVIGLRVGAFSGVIPEALEFAFQAARTGTRAEGARLEIEITPMRAHCAVCDLEFEVQDASGVAVCPVCGEPVPGLRSGDELTVSYLEVL